MTEEERREIHKILWEEQKRILGETDENLGVFVTDEQLKQRLKMLFDIRKEYLGGDKPINKTVPLVSVCIPTYHHKNYIEICLDGALMQQTTFLYEIIVCDDGSTDGTAEICRTYAEKHPDKIRLYDHNRAMTRLYDSKGNVKGGYNWWWTLESARGKYIAICEGDDYWIDPLKLQKQVDFLEKNTDCSLVFSNRKVLDKTGLLTLKMFENKVRYCKDIMSGFIPPTQTIMYRNEKYVIDFLKRHSNFFSGDRMLAYICSIFGNIGMIDDITAVYRESDSGIWSRLGRLEQIKQIAIGFEQFYHLIGLTQNNEYCTQIQLWSFCAVITHCLKYPSTINKANFQFLMYIWKKQRPAKRLIYILGIIKYNRVTGKTLYSR